MEAKELMTGVFVYFCCFDGSKIVARVIGFKDGIVYGDSKEGSHWCNIEKVEPISLTPEILEKNGWKVKKGFVQHGNFGDGPLMLWHTEDNKILRNFVHELEISDLSTDKGYRVRIECNYVHELQMALRLCGIEKEIEL